MIRKGLAILLALSCLFVLSAAWVSAAPDQPTTLSKEAPTRTLLAAPMAIGFGSTVGPDGFLYVTDTTNGQVLRVDRKTGAATVFAYGLPKIPAGWGDGGAFDVAFIDEQAYVLVSEVDPDATGTGNDVDGIYRVDGPNTFKIIADLGAWSKANLPPTSYFLDTGVQFAFEPYGHGFIVNDAHHNRTLYVALDGTITQLVQFADVVPTGLTRRGNRIFMSQAGPLIPGTNGADNVEIGQVVQLDVKTSTARELVGGIPLPIDVAFGPGRGLYVLSQGTHKINSGDGSPADPNTGALLRINPDLTTTKIADLNLPTSINFVGNTAYVVCYTGEIWKISGITPGPHSDD